MRGDFDGFDWLDKLYGRDKEPIPMKLATSADFGKFVVFLGLLSAIIGGLWLGYHWR